jgi:hypothetical protein
LPNATSSIFGDLVYFLSNSPQVYKELYDYYQSTAQVKSNLIKEKKLRDFAKKVFEYFYSEKWELFLNNTKTMDSNINNESDDKHTIESLD